MEPSFFLAYCEFFDMYLFGFSFLPDLKQIIFTIVTVIINNY